MLYIETDSTDAAFYFALEQYLMTERNLPQEQIFLFWRTCPTLMIGRYQNTLEEINLAYAKAHGIKIVRRVTGGGTIYTDMGGWQFSFITRGAAGQIRFDDYLRPVIDALAAVGVTAEFNSRNDLTIGGRKISGNAQCMKNGYTLHHGSLLYSTDFEQMLRCLSVDEEKIISKGIRSVRERTTNISEHLDAPIEPEAFKALMVRHIAGSDAQEYTLTPQDMARVEAIAQQKFRAWEWNFGASPKFNITRSNRFAGGKVTFRLDVDKGIIQGCHVSGDFFGAEDADRLFDCLIGCPYRREDITAHLAEAGVAGALYRIELAELVDTIIA